MRHIRKDREHEHSYKICTTFTSTMMLPPPRLTDGIQRLNVNDLSTRNVHNSLLACPRDLRAVAFSLQPCQAHHCCSGFSWWWWWCTRSLQLLRSYRLLHALLLGWTCTPRRITTVHLNPVESKRFSDGFVNISSLMSILDYLFQLSYDQGSHFCLVNLTGFSWSPLRTSEIWWCFRS